MSDLVTPMVFVTIATAYGTGGMEAVRALSASLWAYTILIVVSPWPTGMAATALTIAAGMGASYIPGYEGGIGGAIALAVVLYRAGILVKAYVTQQQKTQ